MVTKEQVKKLGLKCLEDDDFRRKFENDPIVTAATIGITLDEETAKKITAAMSKKPIVTDGVVSHAVQTVI